MVHNATTALPVKTCLQIEKIQLKDQNAVVLLKKNKLYFSIYFFLNIILPIGDHQMQVECR